MGNSLLSNAFLCGYISHSTFYINFRWVIIYNKTLINYINQSFKFILCFELALADSDASLLVVFFQLLVLLPVKHREFLATSQ